MIVEAARIRMIVLGCAVRFTIRRACSFGELRKPALILRRIGPKLLDACIATKSNGLPQVLDGDGGVGLLVRHHRAPLVQSDLRLRCRRCRESSAANRKRHRNSESTPLTAAQRSMGRKSSCHGSQGSAVVSRINDASSRENQRRPQPVGRKSRNNRIFQ